MKAYSPIEHLDRQVPVLMFVKLDFSRFLSEFHLRERRGGTLLH